MCGGTGVSPYRALPKIVIISTVRFRSGAVASRRLGSGRVTIKVMSACFMLSRLVPFWFALMLGPTPVADARQDCARSSGDAAIAACSQVIQQNPGDSG